MTIVSSPLDVRTFCSSAFATWPSLRGLDKLLGSEVDQEVTNMPKDIAVIRPIDASDAGKTQFGPFIIKRSHELVLDIWGEPEQKVVFAKEIVRKLNFRVDYNPVVLQYESVEAALLVQDLYLVRFDVQQLR